MSFVLVIEPDAVQADALRGVLTTVAGADVLVVASKDDAVTSVDARVPDLVLVHALMSPRDEDALIAHLRTLPDAGHLQTLTIPRLRQTQRETRGVLSIFGRGKRRRSDELPGGCDPTQFGGEVAEYLTRAQDVKAQIERLRATDAARRAAGDPLSVVEADQPCAVAEQPVGGPTTEERGPTGVAHFGIDVAGSGAAGTTDGRGIAPLQPGTTLAAELDRVRADADHVLATELGLAEGRHRADIARLETDAAMRADAAARDAQKVAEAQADRALAAELDRVRGEADQTLATQLREAEERHRADTDRHETDAAKRSDAAVRKAQASAAEHADQALAAEVERVRVAAHQTLVAQLTEGEERHRADIARIEAAQAGRADAAVREAQKAAAAQVAQALGAAVGRVRADAEQKLADELALAEKRHHTDLARLEADAAARDAQKAAERQATDALGVEVDRSMGAEVDRQRADAEQKRAAELAEAEERHRADIARLETDAAKRAEAAVRKAQKAAAAQAAKAMAAEVDRVRVAADQTLVAQLSDVEERHRADIARIEAAQAERADAAVREAQKAAAAQVDQALGVEVDRVRAEAEQKLADELAQAEERHHRDLARLEAEASERADGAAQDARQAAEARANETFAAELDRVRANAAQTLAAELASAEERHRSDIARFEAEAVEMSDARATAEAQAGETLAAERVRTRTDAERTLAAELAAAQERHCAEIVSLQAEAAAKRDTAARAAQVAAEALVEETLAAERERLRVAAELALTTELTAAEERHRRDIARVETEAAQEAVAGTRAPRSSADAQAIQTLAAELDRVRDDAARMLAAELAAAEERSRAEILRVRADTQRIIAEKLEQVQIRVGLAQTSAGEQPAGRQQWARRGVSQPRARASDMALVSPASHAHRPFQTYPLKPIQDEQHGQRGATDYYELWKTRFEHGNALEARVVEGHPPHRGRTRRLCALAVAAILVVLLTNGPASDSALGRVLAAGTAGVSQVLGPTISLQPVGAPTEADIEGTPRTDTTSGGSGEVTKETVGFVLVLLVLLATLFVGEGFVWHGLVVTFGVVLFGFILMRAPPPVELGAGPMTASGENEVGTSAGSGE